MMEKTHTLKAFTLVELIVVITILAILWTIAFVSFQWFALSARDSARINDIKVLEKWLSVYETTQNTLPLPDDAITLTASWTIIIYQWYAGTWVLNTLKQSWPILDPILWESYTYSVTQDRQNFQMLAYLEKNSLTWVNLPLISETYAAATYADMYPRTFGDPVGILLDSTTNEPIQRQSFSGSTVDILNTWITEYKAYLSNTENIEWTWSTLSAIIPNGSCNRILQLWNSEGDGVYNIAPDGESFEVYCDMSTEWGWWTAATMLANTNINNLFDTGNTEKIISLSQNISSKWIISDIWMDNRNKNIMLLCKTNNNDFKNYETPFIIYDFMKSDVWNLEKNNKAGSTFTSVNLTWSWKNRTYLLSQNYHWSGQLASFYIMEENSQRVIYGIYRWRTLITFYDTNIALEWTQAFSVSWNEANQNLDWVQNYCVTYIK